MYLCTRYGARLLRTNGSNMHDFVRSGMERCDQWIFGGLYGSLFFKMDFCTLQAGFFLLLIMEGTECFSF